jgi:hypothetical protein
VTSVLGVEHFRDRRWQPVRVCLCGVLACVEHGHTAYGDDFYCAYLNVGQAEAPDAPRRTVEDLDLSHWTDQTGADMGAANEPLARPIDHIKGYGEQLVINAMYQRHDQARTEARTIAIMYWSDAACPRPVSTAYGR